MSTEIQTWEIREGRLVPLKSSLTEAGRLESVHLEEWIATDPAIVGAGLYLIGRQVMTQSGPLDLLGIDRSGDLVIIELKRDRLPREALAQAIDYASDIASWSTDKISEVCARYTGEGLEDVFTDTFPDVDVESLNINERQRIVLVGFGAASSLERMVEWLSETYGVRVNIVILKYTETATGSETLTRTVVISEEVEEQRSRGKAFKIPMSDEPGTYPDDELQRLLREYLSQEMITAQRIRDILIPACLERENLTREELRQEFIAANPDMDPGTAGYSLTGISNQMGIKKNDFLRQVIGYSYPNHSWEKDDYFIRPEYRQLVASVLEEIQAKKEGY